MQPLDGVANHQWVSVAKILNAYGVRGYIKLQSLTAEAEHIKKYSEFLCRMPQTQQETMVQLEELKQHNQYFVARIAGCHDRDNAQNFRGSMLMIKQEQLLSLAPDQYYWHQLLGLQVWANNAPHSDILLGTITDIMATGANDVLVVEACDASVDNNRRLIPWVMPNIVHDIQIDTKKLRVHWPIDYE